MSAPSAESLFLQLWCTYANREHACVPGTPDWRRSRYYNFEHWQDVWLECKALAGALEAQDGFMTEVADAAFAETQPEATANDAD